MPDLLLVSGLGRCGTSLCCQMLAAGGVTVAGAYPAFEPLELVPLHHGRLDFMSGLASGTAVKFLDPQIDPRLPAGNHRAVWLHRNFREQAKSQVKLLRYAGLVLGRHAAARVRRSLAGDAERGLSVLRRSIRSASPGEQPPHLVEINFEDLLAEPRRAAVALARWSRHPGFDIRAAAGCVWPRGPACLRGFLELRLMEGAPAPGGSA